MTIEEIIEDVNRPFKEIQGYAKMALTRLGLRWRMGYSDLGVYQNIEGYWIQFFDESNKPHEVTLYNPPLEADDHWYIEEITRQLQEKLNKLR